MHAKWHKKALAFRKSKENLEGIKEKIFGVHLFVHQRVNRQIADKGVEIRGENITIHATTKNFSGEEISENYTSRNFLQITQTNRNIP